MCGIAGYIGRGEFDGERLLDGLGHRGPDSRGWWRTPLANGVNLHLVHTRLKILDLTEAAAQPMRRRRHPASTVGSEHPSIVTIEDEYVLVFNGEIYNYIALRAELEAKGHRFRSTGDTEVLLAGYIEWGRDVFGRLDGMFAVAIYDGPAGRLVLARDHVGLKPLYYARTRDRGIVFASEVRVLTASGLCADALDLAAIGDFLRSGSFSEPSTLFREIRSFPPGHVGLIRLDEGRAAALTTRPYWLPEQIRVDRPLDESSWEEEHRARLVESVKEQLVADVPVGVFLSGGIDSSLILQLAAAAGARERITAFTLAGATTEYDESAIAAQTARSAGIRHMAVSLDEKEAASWALDGLAAMDLPSADGLNTYMISRAARAHGLIAVLSGIGADELHGAYGHPRSLARVIRLFRAAGPLRPVFAALATQSMGLARGKIAAERLAELLAAIPLSWRVLQEKRRFFTESQIREFWPSSVSAERGSRPYVDRESFLDQGLEEQLRLSELSGYLVNTLLRDADWATMANHQELRAPFLGRRYMECILKAPERFTAEGHGPKPQLTRVLSASARPLTSLPKRGFTLNYASWLCGPMRAEYIRAAAVLGDRLGFTIDAAQSIEKLQASRSQKDARRLWALLALGRYIESHGGGA